MDYYPYATNIKPLETNTVYVDNKMYFNHWAKHEDGFKEPFNQLAVIVDRESPVSSINHESGTYVSSVDISFECNDGEESGCEAVYFTIDGSVPDPENVIDYFCNTEDFSTGTYYYISDCHYSGIEDSKPKFLRIDHDTQLSYFAVDRAGRVEETKIAHFDIKKPWWKGSIGMSFMVFIPLLFACRIFNLKHK